MNANTLPIPVVHHDAAGDAATERIILTATTGEENPAGGNVFETSLLAELRSTSRNPQQIDDIFAALVAAFQEPGALIYAAELFPGGLWYLNEESKNERSDSRDTRKRSRTYAFSCGHVE